MSKTVDQRVVEMQFDNKNFERNVSTSMSTLEKFNAKLNFTGAAKSFNEISSAASKVDISPIGKGIETVQAKFSSMQVMGVTALANITNSAVNAAKNMAAAFTTAPIHSGFSEYELKMGSIQTIMAGTGESLETVNKYLNELNEYSDKTIYSFQDMTSNIGKFTNAGVKLEDAVAAIQGISNEAALSGANANEASRAMYNFAQALSSGYVKLIDWKSIELANMATQDFKNQLLETAVSLGTVVKTSDGMYETLEGNLFNATKNFNDVLQDQWMTSDVLITTLKKYSDTTTDIGKKATEAATRVKTFSQLMDTTKESLQSGWAQTFEIIIGDFDESTNLFTKISEKLGNVIGVVTDARNNMLKSALGTRSTDNWDTLTERIKAAGVSADAFTEKLYGVASSNGIDLKALVKQYGSLSDVFKKGKLPIKVITETLKKFVGAEEKAVETTKDVNAQLDHFKNLVTKVVRGDFGNGAARVKALTAAGEDYATVQAMVNQCWKDGKLDLSKLTVEQIENIGYTKEQAENIKQLAVEAEKTGKPIEELIKQLEKPSGKDLLFEAFANIGEQFKKIMQAFKDAWGNMFGDVDPAQSLYNAIEGFKEFTDTLEVTEEEAENFKRVFEGLLAIFKLSNSIVSMSLIGGLKILDAVLSLFGMDLLDLAAIIADYIVKFADWVDKNTLFLNTWSKIGKIIYVVIDGVYSCVKAFAELDVVQGWIKNIVDWLEKVFGSFEGAQDGGLIDNFTKMLENAFDRLEKWIRSLNESKDLVGDIVARFKRAFSSGFGNFSDFFGDFDAEKIAKKFHDAFEKIRTWISEKLEPGSIGKFIVDGLIKGIGDELSGLVKTVIELGKLIISTVCDVLGIQSPSTAMIAIGGFIIAGLISGLQDGASGVWDAVRDLGTGIINTLKELDLGTIVTAIIGFGIVKAIMGLSKAVDFLTTPIKKLYKLSDGIAGLFKSVEKYIDAQTLSVKANAMKTFAIAIAILAGAVWLLATKCEPDMVWSSVGAIVVLAGAMAGLAWVVGQFGPKEALKIAGVAPAIVALGIAIAAIAGALFIISKIDASKLDPATGTLALILGAMGGLIYMVGTFGKLEKDSSTLKMGGTFLAMAVSILIIAKALEKIAGIKEEAIGNAVGTVTILMVLMGAIMAVSKFAGSNADKAAALFLGVAVALLIVVNVIEKLASLPEGAMGKAVPFLLGFATIVGVLMYISSFAAYGGAGLAKVLLSIAAVLLVVVKVVENLGEMNAGVMNQGLTGIKTLATIIGILMVVFAAISWFVDGGEMGKVALALFGIAAVMLVMAKVVEKMGVLDAATLLKGGLVVVLFGVFINALVKSLAKHDATKMGKVGLTLLGIAAAIGIMAVVVALLGLLDAAQLAKGIIAVGFLSLFVAGMTAATKNAKDVKGTMIGIAAAIGVMAIALVALSYIPTDKLIPAVAALSVVMGMLTLMILSTSKLGGSTKQLGMFGLMIVALIAIAKIIWELAEIKNLDAVLPIAASLAVVLLAISVAAMVLTKIGPMATMATAAIKPVLILLGIVAAIATAIVWAFSNWPDEIGGVIDRATPVVEKLGGLFGAFVKGFAGTILDILPMIGTSLSAFALNATPFIMAMKLVGWEAVKGATSLAGAILVLTAAELITGITQFFTIGNSFAKMGKNLSDFALAATPFILFTNMLKPEGITAAKNLAELILILTKAELLSGITSFLGLGEGSLKTFGEQLVPFGEALVDFSNTIAPEGKSLINETAINAAKNAGLMMVELANAIPNSGGLLGNIFGDNDLDVFGEKIKTFGQAMVDFSGIVAPGGAIAINEAAVQAGKNAGLAIVELANAIPNSGGLLSKITGDNDLGTFGETIKSFGQAMVDFCGVVAPEGKSLIDTEAIEAAANMGLLMTELANAIPETGGLFSKFTGGKDDLEDFGDNLEAFGKSLKKFANKVAEIDITNLPTIVTNLKTLLSLSGKLKDFDKNMGEKGGEGVKAFAGALDDANETMLAAGEKIAGKVIEGVRNQNEAIYNVGVNFAKGFGKGIGDTAWFAEEKAEFIAEKAAEAAMKELDEHSPSRVGHGIGSFFGIGFANGIASTVKRAYDASTEMATSAKNGLTKVVSRVADIISTDIDTQPTIRPVLDLSDVSANAGKIDRMLNVNPSLGVLANVSAINSMMSGNQNGGNEDVVSAIKDLKGVLGDIPGTTYMVNGVTYDDGTNVANAVGDLVRYARIERRA